MKTQHWMESMYDILKNRKLNEIALPGTHDSGTYNLEKKIAPDAEEIIKIFWKLKAEGSFRIEDFILDWAKCQDYSIYNQLKNGIRYIDLRVCWTDNNFHTCHTLLGESILTLLKDMKMFLKENRREIIVVKVGFKELDDNQENEAKRLFKDTLGDLYTETDKELPEKTYGDIIKTNKRALFDYNVCIKGNWANKDTTSEVLDYLKEELDLDELNNPEKLFEAQFNLTAQLRMFVESFLQTNGCRLIPVIPLLMSVPIIGPTLTVLGITSIVSYTTYLKNCSRVPESVSDLADSSRTVIKDYFEWYVKGLTLDSKPIKKFPNLFICDFFSRMPFVDIVICMNKYKNTQKLASEVNKLTLKIDNTWNSPREGVISNFLDCSADKVAAALLLAKYAASEVAGVLKEGFDYSAKKASDLLKKTGFPADDIAKALKNIYELPFNKIGDILKEIGFPNQQIAGAFNDIGVKADDAIDYFRSTVGDDAIASFLETAGYSKKEVEGALKKVCGCITKVCSCITKEVCSCVTKEVCSCVTKKVCSCVTKEVCSCVTKKVCSCVTKKVCSCITKKVCGCVIKW